MPCDCTYSIDFQFLAFISTAKNVQELILIVSYLAFVRYIGNFRVPPTTPLLDTIYLTLSCSMSTAATHLSNPVEPYHYNLYHRYEATFLYAKQVNVCRQHCTMERIPIAYIHRIRFTKVCLFICFTNTENSFIANDRGSADPL